MESPHFFTPKSSIICILHIIDTKPRKDPHKNKKFQERLVRFGFSAFFYPGVIYHMYFSYSIYLSSKKLARPHKFEIPRNTSQIRTLHVFLPRNQLSYWNFKVTGEIRSLDDRIFENWFRIRISRGRFGGSQSWNIDISIKSEFHINQWKSMKVYERILQETEFRACGHLWVVTWYILYMCKVQLS